MMMMMMDGLGQSDKDRVRVSYFQNSPLVRLALICRSEPSEISCYDWSAIGDWGKSRDFEVERREGVE